MSPLAAYASASSSRSITCCCLNCSAVIGETDAASDAALDWTGVTGEPLPPITIIAGR